jgi:hypothetical protein
VRRSGSLAASRHATVHILSRRRRTPARSIGCVSSHSTGRKREGNNRCSVNGGPHSLLSLPIPPAGKSHRRPAKATARDQSSQPALPLQTLDRTTLPLLPVEIGIGDRLRTKSSNGRCGPIRQPSTVERVCASGSGAPDYRSLNGKSRGGPRESRESAASMTDRRLATRRATLGFPELPPRAGAAADPPVARQLGGRRADHLRRRAPRLPAATQPHRRGRMARSVLRASHVGVGELRRGADAVAGGADCGASCDQSRIRHLWCGAPGTV